MAAGKRLPGLCVTVLVLAALLFFFSAPLLLWLLLVLLGLTALVALLLWLDARRLKLTLHAPAGGRVGQPLALQLKTDRRGPFLAAGHAAVELELDSEMFGVTARRQFLLPLRSNTGNFETTLTAALCGETRLRCRRVSIQDVFGLFRFSCAPFAEVRTLLYPQPVNIQLLFSQNTVGSASAEGRMQNRRGSDPSEIFDLREYVPGDDIRSIHWKLSCKTDALIVRQASDPTHYDVALMPDLAFDGQSGIPTPEELNAAVAVVTAVGEQLLAQNTPFCLAVPTRQGLQLWEVRSQRRLHQLLPQWMSIRISRTGGVGLQYFQTDHLEQHFTRLVLLSAGRYGQDITGLDRRIGISVVSTVHTQQAPAYAAVGATSAAALLPTRPQNRDESWRVLC